MSELAPSQTKVMKNIVAGNWKSNKLMAEALEFVSALNSKLTAMERTEVVIAPPAPYLAVLAGHVGEHVHVAGQNCSATGAGAFTGEFTAEMLRSCGVRHVIIGHSERREGFGETNDVVRAKLERALASGLCTLLCCGEPLQQREAGTHFTWVEQQLRSALASVDASIMSNVVIAYEPIWAIGTGRTATADQAQEMHAFIRALVGRMFTDELAAQVRILYGGSCNPSNAHELFSQPDVNGGLIGGASLEPESFRAIIEASEMQSA